MNLVFKKAAKGLWNSVLRVAPETQKRCIVRWLHEYRRDREFAAMCLAKGLTPPVVEKILRIRDSSDVQAGQLLEKTSQNDGDGNTWIDLALHQNIRGYAHLAQACIDRAWSSTKKPVPRTVSVLVTLRYNLKCSHCWYRTSSDHEELSSAELKTGEFIKALTTSTILKEAALCFSGGEVFVRPDLEEVLAALAENGQRFILNTNGWYTDRLARLLDDGKIRSKIIGVSISMDGPEDVHDRIRGKGSFARLKASAAFVRQAGVKLLTQTVIQTSNATDLAKAIDAAKAIGSQEHFFNVEINDLEQIQLGQSEQAKYLDGWTLILHCLRDRFPKGQGCLAGSMRCEIQPDGRVLPCPMVNEKKLAHLMLGNLRDYDLNFDRLWYSSEAANRRALISSCIGCANPCWR